MIIKIIQLTFSTSVILWLISIMSFFLGYHTMTNITTIAAVIATTFVLIVLTVWSE